MKRCPISFQEISSGNYSSEGLHSIHPKLTNLSPLPLTKESLLHEAARRAQKMSIQGAQPKLSATLSIKNHCFNIVDNHGSYILKPQTLSFPQLPENEALSMSLANLAGIPTPPHGLLYTADNSLVYFIKRFDRTPRGHKIALEDFSQLLGYSRETKYNASVEKVISVIDKFASFPVVEKQIFFKRFIFNFLIGNEDMHLKNYSLIERNDIFVLAPPYDFLNTTIVLPTKEQSALPLNSKKSNLSKDDLLLYLAKDRLHMTDKQTNNVLNDLSSAINPMLELIQISFLEDSLKLDYAALLRQRASILELG